MRKKRIFISSVQNEFHKEREALWEYIFSDALLGLFFDPFAFEQLPASDRSAKQVYLREVEQSDIYLGILGKDYGYEDEEGISPTEREFDHASALHKTRLLYLSSHELEERHPKEQEFIKKAQKCVVRKQFQSLSELKAAVYASLVNYLLEKEIIQKAPFDANFNDRATIKDIDPEKLSWFIQLARSKRGFPLSEVDSVQKVLTHLNLMEKNKIRNAALLLFAYEPQNFFINSEVRCARFYGNIVEKPIPSYKVFKGNVFELIDQSVDFVLSKLDYRVETRAQFTSIPGKYEIPPEIITEAIVNAVAHRDYTSNASIQVMIFRDRIEIWNPGMLPIGWSTDKLKETHPSIPANPLLAEPMYLAGYIERMGTGTSDMLRSAKKAGLKEPIFIQEDAFKTIIFRTDTTPTTVVTDQVTVQATDQATDQVSEEIQRLLFVLKGEMKRSEIQDLLSLKHSGNFRNNYILPALERGFIEMTIPESPSSPNQKYKLSTLGNRLRKQLKKVK